MVSCALGWGRGMAMVLDARSVIVRTKVRWSISARS